MKIQDSEVLKDRTMQKVKQSLENISSIDNQEEFRVDMLEYINYSSYNNNDMFFYDMMEFIRFLKPDDDSVAYTTPEHLIYLNSPGKIGKNKHQWDFIYDHECMHQLWETFGVEDKIKDELGKCDRMLLNIASDCVINDYLDHYRKKEMPDNLITPDFLEDKRRVECLPIRGHYPIAMPHKKGFAVASDVLGGIMDYHPGAAGKPTESPKVVVAHKIMNGYSFGGHSPQLI